MKWMVLMVISLLVLTACAETSIQGTLDADARVQQFKEIWPNAVYEQASVGNAQMRGLTDLFAQECIIEPPFTRATYTQYGARLIAYEKEGEIVCLLSRVETAPLNAVQGNPDEAPEGVALTVNGEPVMMERVQAAFATLPQDQQTIQSVNTILDQLVTAELLRQEASSYVPAEEEVETAYQNLVTQSGMDAAAFASALEEQGTTVEDVRDVLRENLAQQALLNEKLNLDVIPVDEEQARNMYLQNTQSFLVSEQATFRQIFIGFADKTPEDAVAKANQAVSALETMEFCEVVRRYSEDAESIEQCGEYTIPRGVVAAQIEQAAFGAPLNQATTIQTEAGLHILVPVARQPSGVIPYEQVADQVRGLLENQVAQLRLNAYTASLRQDANVVVYLTLQTGDANA